MKTIMVIDDSLTIRMSVELAIKGLGYPICQAENGEEAIKKVNEIKGNGGDTALCIVDVNMPVMDGITFVWEFRKIDKFTPVLILTTESEETMIMKGKEAGASGWHVKPFQTEELVNVVQKLIK